MHIMIMLLIFINITQSRAAMSQMCHIIIIEISLDTVQLIFNI